MMKKTLILIIISIMLCGCDANYKVRIGSDGVYENISLTSTEVEAYQNQDLKDFLQSFINSNIPNYFNPDVYDDMSSSKQDGVSYYNIIRNDNGIDVTGDFSLSDIYRSRAIKACYDEITIQKYDNTYRVNTNNNCKAFDDYSLLKNLTIDIEVDYDVISSNADVVNGNHYVWNLNEDNYDSKYISLVFSVVDINIEKKSDVEEYENENQTNKYSWANEHPLFVILITFGSFFLILFIVMLIYKRFR